MKPLSEWTENDLRTAISHGYDPDDDALAELLRRECEAMKERCAAVADGVVKSLSVVIGTPMDGEGRRAASQCAGGIAAAIRALPTIQPREQE